MSTERRNDNGEEHGWETAWHSSAQEVDQRIVSFMEDAEKFNPQSLAELSLELRDWLDGGADHSTAESDWCELRPDERRFRARIEQRIANLMAEGRIQLRSWRGGQHN